MINKVLILLLISIQLVFAQELFFENPVNAKLKDSVIAKVGNIKITSEEFIYGYEFGPAFPKRVQDSKKVYLNYLINEKLLALEGYSENIFKNDFSSDMYNSIVADITTEQMFTEKILPGINIEETEIEKVIDKKQTEYSLRWLYSKDKLQMDGFVNSLKNGIPFDSLFFKQLSDSVTIDDRQLKTSLYDIYLKNPFFATIIDSMSNDNTSAPIEAPDGWYLIKIDNKWKTVVTNETELNKLRSESINAIKKSKMDAQSDKFVKDLFKETAPVINKESFSVAKAFLGKFVLDSLKFNQWRLIDILDSSLAKLRKKRGEQFKDIVLVEGKSLKISLEEFIRWFRVREQFLKINKTNISAYSKSMQDYVWLMVRDRLLSDRAIQLGYNKSDWVIKQSKWWKDKICYSTHKNEISKSVVLSNDERNLVNDKGKSADDILNEKFNRKLFLKLSELKKKYKVIINDNILNSLQVSEENNKNSIDLYIVKRGNLIPRTPYPCIDNEWQNWQ